MYQPLLLTLLVFGVNALPASFEKPTGVLAAGEPISSVDLSNEQKIPVAIETKSGEELNQGQQPQEQQQLNDKKNVAGDEDKLEDEKSDLSKSETIWGGWGGGYGGGWGGGYGRGYYNPGYYGGWRRSYGGWGYPSYGGWRRYNYWG